jgi:hypothetical protein
MHDHPSNPGGGLADNLRAQHTTTQGAARELGRGLMRGDRPSFKLGYSWENAAAATERMFELPKPDTMELQSYLLGFAVGLNKQANDYAQIDTEMDEVIHELAGSRDDERFRAAYEEGYKAGWDENAALTLPADFEPAVQRAKRQRAAAETLSVCGCGATTLGECCAAVEGYFTSLGQRSNEELHELAEGDGCEAARVMLVRRAHEQQKER